MIPLSDDNPTYSRPYVTLIILFICLFIFLIQVSLHEANDTNFIYALGFIPAVTFGHADLPSELVWIPSSLTIFSSMFLHGGFFHLAGNMLYLWIFADNVEDRMGHKNFFIFYFLCGFVAAMTQALPETGSTIPMIGIFSFLASRTANLSLITSIITIKSGFPFKSLIPPKFK